MPDGQGEDGDEDDAGRYMEWDLGQIGISSGEGLARYAEFLSSGIKGWKVPD